MSLLGETAELAILLRLKDEVTGPLGRIDRSLSGLNTRTTTVQGGLTKMGAGGVLALERLAVAAVGASVAIGKISIDAVHAATDYQQAMELVRTQTGATQAEVDSMTKSVLDLAPAVGIGPQELAAGLYHVESAGLRGARALDVLSVAAQGAKIGNADLESVTNALVAAEQSGVKGASDMQTAMGTLNGIVGAGNMRMQDLADAMGSGILASAKTFGVSLQDVGAALATMTDEGVPAVDAATRLRMTLSLLGAPTAGAAKDLKAIGLSSLDLANAMRSPQGLVGAIGLLRDHMVSAGLIDKNGNINSRGAQLLSDAFGGGRSSSTIMTLLGNYDLLVQKQQAVNKGATGFADAWQATADTVAQKRSSVGAALDALQIKLGQDLLPAESAVLGGFQQILESPEATKAIDDFGNALASMFSPENVESGVQFAKNVIPQIEGFASETLPSLIDGLKVAGQITKTAFDLFNQLPEPLKAAIIGGLAVNKLSGGMLGSGLVDTLRALAGGGGKGVGGGAVGSLLGVQKVFVTNWPPGGFGPGGGGGGGPSEGIPPAAAVPAASILPTIGEVATLAPWFAAIGTAALPLVLPTILKDIKPNSPEYLSNVGKYNQGTTTNQPYSYLTGSGGTGSGLPITTTGGVASPDQVEAQRWAQQGRVRGGILAGEQAQAAEASRWAKQGQTLAGDPYGLHQLTAQQVSLTQRLVGLQTVHADKKSIAAVEKKLGDVDKQIAAAQKKAAADAASTQATIAAQRLSLALTVITNISARDQTKATTKVATVGGRVAF